MAPKKKSTTTTGKETENDAGTNLESTTPPASPPIETIRSSATIAEMYAKLQSTVTEDPSKINENLQELLQMLTEAESPETPILIRVRTLEFISRYGQHLRDGNALKKVVASLVKILSGPDDTPQLLIAAVQGLASLGSVSVLDKSWEYLSREGADVLMQIVLDHEGFTESVRQAANKAIDTLVHTAFRPFVTKLLHWLSDNRGTEEEEQLIKERRMALTKLRKVAEAPSLRAQWTDEVQEDIFGLLISVLSTVTLREFSQLVRIAVTLPKIQEKGGLPLLTSFIGANKLYSDRALESLSIIAQHIHATPYDITPALEEAKLLKTPVDTNSLKGIWQAKILLLAVRLATPENTNELYNIIFEQLQHVMGDGSVLPNNLTILEILLIAFITIGNKKPAELLKQLNEDNFTEKCNKLVEQVNQMESLLIYAVKRLMQKSNAGPKEAEAIACCQNIKVILTAFSSKHIPMGTIVESWINKNKLPTLKRGRESINTSDVVTSTGARGGIQSATTPLGVLPPPPGTEDHTRKKVRVQGSYKNNNNNNNKGGRGNAGRPQRARRGRF